MKKSFVFIMLVLALVLCGCGAETETAAQSDGLSIVTTVFPAYDFARSIAGDLANVTMLVPPGTESHSFEPSPRDILRIGSCELLICNGGESEAWLETITDGLDGEVRILTMLECVDALEEEIKAGMQHREHTHDEHDDHGDEKEYDEHVWTSPMNAVRICRAICAELCAADPDNAAVYIDNTGNYCAELLKLDEAFRTVCEGTDRHTLIFADRFPVRYFVEEYGLEYYAAFPGCADDAEPSARTVAFLIDRVREDNIPAVLYIEFSDRKMADVICAETGCEKLLFHSCHNVGADELADGVTYLELMWSNVETLKEALG